MKTMHGIIADVMLHRISPEQADVMTSCLLAASRAIQCGCGRILDAPTCVVVWVGKYPDNAKPSIACGDCYDQKVPVLREAGMLEPGNPLVTIHDGRTIDAALWGIKRKPRTKHPKPTPREPDSHLD